MSDFRTVHEAGVLKDIFDYISGSHIGKENSIADTVQRTKYFVFGTKGEDSDKLIEYNRYKNSLVIDSNIARTSRSLTAVFPVIVSKSVDIDKAVMVSKAIERKCVAMLQMLFTSNQITNVYSAKDFFKRFHKNISSSLDLSRMSVDDFLEYTGSLDGSFSEEAAIVQNGIRAVNEDVRKNIHHVLETQLSNKSISDLRVSLTESRFSSTTFGVRNTNTTRVDHDPDNREPDQIARSGRSDVYFTNQPLTANDAKQAVEAISKSILDGDIKKANEAQPSMVIVNFITLDKDSKQQIMNTCVFGVKALIHYVDPQDIVNRVLLKQSDSRGLFNLIRATTREISFFKDFLFAVNRAKVDAIARSGRGSTDKIWKLLELRADRLRGAKVTQSNQAASAAITTLVISKAEVDYIKQFHRIDLGKSGTLAGILRGYNMMACAIIDEVSERVDFLWDDGTNAFESLSFMSLEREESGAMYKKVINLATRGR